MPEKSYEQLFDLIDRHHAENKGWHAEFTAWRTAQQTKCMQHEFDQKRTDERLKAGAEAFDAIRKEIKPQSLWRLIPMIVPAVVFICTVVWGASKFVSWTEMAGFVDRRSPYIEDKQQIMRVVNAYDAEIPGIRTKLVVIDTKLDAVLKRLDRGE